MKKTPPQPILKITRMFFYRKKPSEYSFYILSTDWEKDEHIKSSPSEKDSGVLVDKKLNMSWHYALVAQRVNHILGTTKAPWAAGQWRWLTPSTLPLWDLTLKTAVRSGVFNTRKRWNKPRGKPVNWSQSWSSPPMTTGWETTCSAWRREGRSRKISLKPLST